MKLQSAHCRPRLFTINFKALFSSISLAPTRIPLSMCVSSEPTVSTTHPTLNTHHVDDMMTRMTSTEKFVVASMRKAGTSKCFFFFVAIRTWEREFFSGVRRIESHQRPKNWTLLLWISSLTYKCWLILWLMIKSPPISVSLYLRPVLQQSKLNARSRLENVCGVCGRYVLSMTCSRVRKT